ncbi:MAG: ROK family protein [Bacteroidota bacterium]
MNNTIWGIDLGGTKIEGVVLDPNDNSVVSRTRLATEADQGYEHVLQRIKLLIDQIAQDVGHHPARLGIGTPGAIDPHTHLLKNSNSTALNKKPFKKDLEQVLGIPIEMANDANCFALAEARMGIVQEINPKAKVVFGVIMGTGVGGGVVVNGQIINGNQGIAGEWGHNFLDESGGQCYCGKIGCVERIISGTSLERYYHEISDEQLALKLIMQKYQQGDKNARKTVERLIHFFGLGISSVINILDPEIIVIGGGVGNIDLLYTKGVEEAAKYTFNTRFDTKIVKPKLGDSAGVFGAAFLVT